MTSGIELPMIICGSQYWHQNIILIQYFARKLIRDNTTAQVFIYGKGDNNVYPLKYKAQADGSLVSFIHDIGIPRDLVTDRSK